MDKGGKYFSLGVGIFVALMIFYLSSMSFGSVPKDFNIGIKSIGYHAGVFFFLASFLLMGLVKKYDKKMFVFVMLFSVLYALSDEWHQSFVPGRAMTGFDVFIDSLGILLAGVIHIAFRWRK